MGRVSGGEVKWAICGARAGWVGRGSDWEA